MRRFPLQPSKSSRREFIRAASSVAVLVTLPSVAAVAVPVITDPSEAMSALFGRRLAVAMDRAGIDARELADAAGLTPPGLERLLTGQTDVDFITAEKLSDAVGVDLGKMIDRRQEPF